MGDYELTLGQRLYTLTRAALLQVLNLTQTLVAQGQSTNQIWEVMRPALLSAIALVLLFSWHNLPSRVMKQLIAQSIESRDF